MGTPTIFTANIESAAIELQAEYEACREKVALLWLKAMSGETVEEMREGFQRCEVESARQAAIFNTALACGIALDCS